METKLVESADGAMIAYDVVGDGPAVILLPGLGGDRHDWHDHDIPQRLCGAFTVITIDLRGGGESERFDSPSRYSLNAILDDVYAVVAACNLRHFMVWGWSLGANVALQLAARSDHVTRVVAAGTFFGPVFSREHVQPRLDFLAQMQQLKEAGQLDTLDPDDAAYVAQTDLAALRARLEAITAWPPVAPADLMCPALLLSGSEDAEVVGKLREQRPALEAAGVECVILEGVDHLGLIEDLDAVLPVVIGFLQGD